MTLEQRVNDRLKAAMRAKDQAALRALRAIKSTIMLKKTDGSGEAIDEALEIKILQKLVKQRKESLGIYEAQNREDLAAIEREEIPVIEQFLPQQMDDAELATFLRGIIEQTGASSMKDMGKVMGIASKQLAGRADGKAISSKVRELLG